jgi:CrcB protein
MAWLKVRKAQRGSSVERTGSDAAKKGPALRKLLTRVLGSKMLLIMLGGAIGTYLRYGVGRWFSTQPWGQGFPYGTLFVNVVGSFILGVVATLILERLPPEYQDWYLLLGTGFCGGFTTFSTFEWETFKLVRDGSWPLAAGNVLVSIFAGFIGLVAGVILVGLLLPRRM